MYDVIEYCRQKNFFPSNLLYELLKDGNFEHVKNLINLFSHPDINYYDILDYDKVIKNTFLSNNNELIDYIIKLIGIKIVKFDTFQLICGNENIYLTDFLKISCKNYNIYDTIDIICKYGRINLLDIVMINYHDIDYNLITKDTYISDNLDFVKHLHEKYLDNNINFHKIRNTHVMMNILYNVCFSSNIEIIDYIYNKFNSIDDAYMDLYIYENPLKHHLLNGNNELVNHIIHLFNITNFDYINSCLCAICDNNYSCKCKLKNIINMYGNRLDFYKYYNFISDVNALTNACKNGNIKYVKYILINYPCEDIDKYFDDILYYSCVSNNIELISYLHDKYPKIAESLKNNDYLIKIIKIINLEVAKFLVNNFPEINLEEFISYINNIKIYYVKNKNVIKWIRNGCKMPERKIKCAYF